MLVTCDFCGKSFKKIPAAIRYTNHNFCSRQCAGKFRRKPNKIIIEKEIAKIIIESPKYGINYVIIDISDIDKVKGYNWVLSNKKYVYCNKLNLQIQRVILGYKGNDDIDHINKNPLDNRKCNLRICSHLENMQNQNARKKNSTKVKNIYYDKRNQKYKIDIVYNRKRYYGGQYNKIEDAIIALNNLKKEIMENEKNL